MSHSDAHVSALDPFTWQSTLDSNLDRKGLLLRLFAEQRFMAAQVRACKLDYRDYLLSLIDPASTVNDGTRHSSSVDGHRMRSVITEAAKKAHWGKPPRHGRAQGIAAHYDAQTCMAVVLDIEVSDEGRLIIHDAVVVADLGFLKNPGRVRSQLEGACLAPDQSHRGSRSRPAQPDQLRTCRPGLVQCDCRTTVATASQLNQSFQIR